MKLYRYAFISLLGAVTLLGCTDSKEEPQTTRQKSAESAEPKSTKSALQETDIEQIRRFTQWSAALAFAQFERAQKGAQSLKSAIDTLLKEPTAEHLSEARVSWRNAHSSYLKTVGFSYLPPMDPLEWRQQKITDNDLRRRISAWPIEIGYIDYLKGYPLSGIVNDLALPITVQSVIDQHQNIDETSASLGFQVVEFLLWGEDGNRSASDFSDQNNTQDILNQTDSQSNTDIGVQNHPRRRAFLAIVSQLLEQDITHLTERWSNQGQYAKTLLNQPPEALLKGVFKAADGLITDELLGRRFNTDTSPFSRSSGNDRLALFDGFYLWLLELIPEGEGTPVIHLPTPEGQQKSLDALVQSLKETRSCLIEWQAKNVEKELCNERAIGVLSTLRHLLQGFETNL